MNGVLTMGCVVGFLGLPMAVLLLRALRGRWMPWWAAITIVIVLGWPLVLVAAILDETPDGGAAKVFALVFGWADALAWSLPLLLLYGAIAHVRRGRAGTRGDRSAHPSQ